MNTDSPYTTTVELRKLDARTAKAELLTPVAVAHCLARGWSSAQLIETPAGTWRHLADLVGLHSLPSPTTRAIVVRMVRELLPHPCPRCGGPTAGDVECVDCLIARLRPVLASR